MAIVWHQPNENLAKTFSGNLPQSASNRKNLRFYNIRSFGEYRIRVLPPWSDKGLLGVVVGKHPNIPSPEGEMRSELCVEATHPDRHVPCPICTVIRKFEDMGFDVKKFLVWKSSYVNALIRNAAPGSDAFEANLPYIFRQTPTFLHWLYSQIIDPDVGDFLNPESGRDIKIIKAAPKSKGAFVQYEKTIVHQSSPLVEGEEKISEILNNLYKLDEIWRFPDDEYFSGLQKAASRLESLLGERISQVQSVMSHGHTPPPPATTTHVPSLDLPPNWEAAMHGDKMYYYNTVTGQSQYEKPEVKKNFEPVAPPINPPTQTVVGGGNSHKRALEKPDGSPACFGISDPQHSSYRYDSNSKLCLSCCFESLCLEAQKNEVK